MVFDKLENLHYYLSAELMNKLKPVLARLHPDCDEGCYEVDGDRAYIKVMSYDAKPSEDCAVEAHNRYIDIQSTLSGCEGIGVFEREKLAEAMPYAVEKDVVFYYTPETGMINDLKVYPCYFAMLYPHEAHRPKEFVDGVRIKKFVIKIAVGYCNSIAEQ